MNFFATHAAPVNDPSRGRAYVAVKLVARPRPDEPQAAGLAFTLDLPLGISLGDLRALLVRPEGSVDVRPVVAEKFGDTVAYRFEFEGFASGWTELSCTFALAVPWDFLIERGLGLDVPVALETPAGRQTRSLHDPMRVSVYTALGVQMLVEHDPGRFSFSGLELAPGSEFTVRLRYQREPEHLTKDLRIILDSFADPDNEARRNSWHVELLGFDVSGAEAATCEPRLYTASLERVESRYAAARELVPPFSDDAVWSRGFTPLDVPYLVGFDLGWRDANDWHFYLARSEELYVDCRMRVPDHARPGTVSAPVCALARATLVREVGEQDGNVTTFDVCFMPQVVCKG